MRLVTSLIALAVAGAALVLPSAMPAVADPASGRSRPVAAADATSATVVIAPASSGVLAPGTDLVLSGTISNPTSTDIAAGTATVFLGKTATTTRTDLASWLAPAETSATDKLGIQVLESATPVVPAGRAIDIQLVVPAAAIDLGSSRGVHELAVRVTSAAAQVGQGRSSIVWNTAEAPASTGLAIAVPLTVQTGTDGLIAPDTLADYTGVGGLLTRQLDQVIGRDVAIGVDPRILASIRILGDSVPASAQAWLTRLEGAPNVTFELSYADSDLAAASQAKSTRVLVPSSFPVDASLFPGATTATPTPSAPSATPIPGATPAPEPVILPDVTSLQKLDRSLPSVAWPRDDTVIDSDLDNFATSGLKTSILSSTNLSFGDLDYTPSAAATVGKHDVIVSDSVISGLLRTAATAPTPVEFNQAMAGISSELAIIGSERAGVTVLATLGRGSPGASFRFDDALAAIASLPGATLSPLTTLTDSFTAGAAISPVAATVVAKPEDAARIATVASLLESEATASSFASVLTDQTVITGERRLSLLAILANGWVNDDTWAAATAKYLDRTTTLVGSVSIVKSSSVFITATSTPLPITVTNQLDWPVTVYVTVRSPTGILSIADDRVELTIEAQSQAKVNVPVKSNANGSATLLVSLASATNVPISQPEPVSVDVQAGWETAFTAVVAVVLVGIFGFGIYRTIAKRRKARKARDQTDEDSTEDAETVDDPETVNDAVPDADTGQAAEPQADTVEPATRPDTTGTP